MRYARGLSVVAIGALAAGAHASIMPPDLNGFDIQIESELGMWTSIENPDAIAQVNPLEKQGQYTIVGGATGNGFISSWEIDVDTDPFVVSSFNITNTQATAQVFTVTVLLPIVPQLPISSGIGSVSGSLLDSNDSGASFVGTIAGVPLYEAIIDGSTVMTLYDDPYSLAIGTPTANLPTAGFGPSVFPGASAVIGVRNTFVLSPGDTFQAVSYFFINAVPTPGALALFGVAGVTVMRRRR